jgi:hypothetical protein
VVEQHLLSCGAVKLLRLGLVAFLFIAAVARPADAQVNSRFAAGAELTVAASDRSSTQDHAASQFFGAPLWRFGTTEPGWGFHWGLNWYAVDIDRPVAGLSTDLGELHVRPIMAGYGYTWLFKQNAITADLLGGYAFAKMDLAGSAADAYRLRMGSSVTDATASNTFVLKPEVAIWHDINKTLGLNINIGYMFARPEVTITTSNGADVRTARADQFLIKVGLVYSIF